MYECFINSIEQHCRSPPPFDFKKANRMEVKGMKKNLKCFIKNENGEYEEITLQELEKRRNNNNTYQNKKFILVDDALLEVSKAIYEDFYYEYERNKYIDKIMRKLQVISIEKLQDSEDVRGIDIIKDNQCNVEKEVYKKIEIEKLREALLSLNDTEYKLIKNVFFDDKTIREYAEIIGLPYSTIQYKKMQILKKLKKLLEN